MAEAFEQQLELADVYAAALIALADEADTIDAVRGELDELVRLTELEPQFADFLSSGAIDDDDRCKSLEAMFRGKLSDLTLNTLQVMNDHGRVHMLRPLLRCYVLRQKHRRGQVEVAAQSAVELSPAQQEEVRQLAAELSGKEPLVEFTVDPDLLGGLVLQIGDYRFDNSVRRHLRTVQRQLAERGERGVRDATETTAS